jgi:signal transduction histidine kinase
LSWCNRAPGPLAIEGPAVRQVILNLLLNACAASPFGGEVTVDVSCVDGALRIAASDEGPGLPDDMAALLSRLDGDAVEKLGAGTGIVVTTPLGLEGARNAA